MNWRSAVSLRALAANADSIWVSIAFSVFDSRPISVPGGPEGTRLDRSPSAMSSAVRSTVSNGRRPIHTTTVARAISTASTTKATSQVINSRRFTVASTECSEIATASAPPSGCSTARTRKPEPPAVEGTVNARPAS
jgi:hypothetical protein